MAKTYGNESKRKNMETQRLEVTHALEVNGADVFSEVAALAGVTSSLAEKNALNKIEETFAFGDFTDNADATGEVDFSEAIPVGATFLYAAVTAITGFTGDTTAVATIGDGTDVDRYNTGTLDVFTTIAAGIAAGDPSGVRYHAAAKTPVVTITGGADFTSIVAGSITVELFYLT